MIGLEPLKPIWSATLPIEAVAKGRPRFTKMGRAFTPAKTRAAEKAVKDLILILKPKEPIAGALALNIEFVLVKPKSVKNRDFPHVRPDLDNYAKLIMDVLQPEIMLDDSQVCQLHLTKDYGPLPMIKIDIYSL